MTDRNPATCRLLELFRPAAPVPLAAFSSLVVWSFHNLGWTGFLLYLLVGFVAGSVTGGLVGVPLLPTWAVMTTAGGLFEEGRNTAGSGPSSAGWPGWSRAWSPPSC